MPTLRTALLALAVALAVTPASAQERPNIVIIYTDDLGYGDVSAYGAGALKTPNIDRLAREGVRFADGHSAAATCTPSRYALLTGEYAWRRPGTDILRDAIVQSDWSVGEILASLNQLGLTDKTLVIFTSDNGPVIDDGYKDDAVAQLGTHTPSGPFRGGKYSNFEAGTRVPLIVRWPGHAKRGVLRALVSHLDFLATVAALTGQTLADAAAPDSVNLINSLPEGGEPCKSKL